MKLQERRKVATWVEEARDGRGEAMDALARFYTRRLGQLFSRRVSDPHLAEDLVQDTLMLGLAGLQRVRDPLCFDAFICRIGRRVVINAYRTRRALVCDPSFITHLEEMGCCKPLRSMLPLPSLAEEAVSRALCHLSVEDKSLVREHHAEGVPLAPLALRSGLTLPTLKMRLLRARRRLKPILARMLSNEELIYTPCRLSSRNGTKARDRLAGHPEARRSEE